MIPSLYLRLADEDEIIGTDWAEMGERAYAYLPFDEEINSRSSNEDNSNLVIDARSQSSRNKSPRLSKLKKLLMVDRTTVIKGVPDLIEEPVLDYGQQKDLGAYPLNSFPKPTGGDLLQKAPTKVMEEHREHETVEFDHHPMSYGDSNNTIQVENIGSLPSGSSTGSSEK